MLRVILLSGMTIWTLCGDSSSSCSTQCYTVLNGLVPMYITPIELISREYSTNIVARIHSYSLSVAYRNTFDNGDVFVVSTTSKGYNKNDKSVHT